MVDVPLSPSIVHVSVVHGTDSVRFSVASPFVGNRAGKRIRVDGDQAKTDRGLYFQRRAECSTARQRIGRDIRGGIQRSG